MTNSETRRRPVERYRTDVVAFLENEFPVLCADGTFRMIELMPHQKKVLNLAFRFDEEGRLPYSTIIYSCPKKSGKTCIAAGVNLWVACCWESYNELRCVANDQEQAAGGVFNAISRAVEHNPRLHAETHQYRIHFPENHTSIAAIPHNYTGQAGINIGMSTWDELWGYTSERSRRLYAELTPVPTRKNSFRLIATYAGFEGESGLLQSLYQRGMSLPVHPEAEGLPIRAGDGMFVYWDTEARMPWQTQAYYDQQAKDLTPAQFLRFHRNQWVQSSNPLVPIEWYLRACKLDGRPYQGMRPDRSIPVCVGVDVGYLKDSSAVVGVYYDQRSGRVVEAFHEVWYPEEYPVFNIRDTVGAYILQKRNEFTFLTIRYDPWQMHQVAVDLANEGLPMEEYPQVVGNLTAMAETLYSLMRDEDLLLIDSPEMLAGFQYAVAKDTGRGIRIVKEKSSHKIDIVVALAMATHAAIEAEFPGESIVEYERGKWYKDGRLVMEEPYDEPRLPEY